MSGLEELLDSGAAAIASAVNAGEVDVAELVEAVTDRAADAPDDALVAVDPEVVAEQAAELVRRLEAGERPALAGVPVAHKDLLDTAAFPTTYGNPALAQRLHGGTVARDAVAVARTIEAGALHVGKANLHEVAYGVTGRNAHTGTPVNPSAPDRIPGGSSSGSASAVVSGAVAASLGTDTGGSVRIPSACCGVVGLKTTRGCVPTTGVLALSWLQDTVGPIARNVADAGLLLSVVAGPDGADPACRPAPAGWDVTRTGPEATGLVVVLPEQMWHGRVDPEVADAVRRGVDTLADAGARVREIPLPEYGEARTAQATLLSAHALAAHASSFADHADLYGDDIRERLEDAAAFSGADVARALRVREQWMARLEQLWGEGAVIASPTLAFPVPDLDAETVTWPDGEEDITPALTRLTSIWNLAGNPAISVPCGAADDAPVGLQLAGPWWSEPTLLRAAAVVEALT